MSSGAAARRDGAVIGLAALVLRLAAVAWAGGGSMPGDAQFYRVLATRIAEGHGYTWAWPDGASTPVAHYPVGWPALLAGFDRVASSVGGAEPGSFLRHPWAAQAFAAAVSAAAAPLVWALVARATEGRRIPALAGALVALHPGLVLYAPALMSEGPTATLLAASALIAAVVRDASGHRRVAWLAALGLVVGCATLVRPQSLLFAPVFAIIALLGAPDPGRGDRARFARLAAAAAFSTAVALAVCAPWTMRNCTAMGRCALVSVNGGWNLLIGSEPGGNGGWSEVKVPLPCREVWDEAAKDACFGRAARERIARDPLAFAALAPRKLAATFDYGGAGPWWLSASRPDRVGPRAKLAAGVVETAFERALLLLGAVAAGRAGPRSRFGRLAVVVAAVMSLQLHAWVAFLALAVALASLGARGVPLLLPATGAAIALTAAVHAAFFGAGRYQIVLQPLLAGLAAMAFVPPRPAPSPPDPAPI